MNTTIAELNDRFRQGEMKLGQYMMTAGGTKNLDKMDKPSNPIRYLTQQILQHTACPFCSDHLLRVKALPKEKQVQLLQLVRDFEQFSPNNDLYGERDFAKVTLDAQNYLWKIIITIRH